MATMHSLLRGTEALSISTRPTKRLLFSSSQRAAKKPTERGTYPSDGAYESVWASPWVGVLE